MYNLDFQAERWIIVLPLILMMADILTGFVCAFAKRRISTKTMREGLSKKLLEILLIVICYFVTEATNIDIPVYKYTSMYVCFSEIVSIFRSMDKAGLTIPKFLKDRFKNE